jgi:uncharacterized protein
MRVEIVGSVTTAPDDNMKIHLEGATGANRIRSYAPGRIAVNQDVYTASLIVTPDRIIADWRPRSVAELTVADIEVVCGLEPEVVLLGTGARLTFPDPTVTRGLVTAQIGFEAMDTGAACRTFNVLMSEGRRVVAALLIELE